MEVIASRLYSCGRRCSRCNWPGPINAPNPLDLLAQIPYLLIILLHSCRYEHIVSVEGKIRVPALGKEGNGRVYSARWPHGACTD